MKAEKIEDIINTFNPLQALDPNDRESWEFYVDTDRNEVLKIKQQLLASKSKIKLLFGGHPGNGKSTELNKLAIDGYLQKRFFVVHYSIKDILDIRDFHLIDLLLSIGFIVYKRAKDKEINLSPDLEEKLKEFQKALLGELEIVQEKSKTGSSKLEIEAKAGAKSPFPFLSFGTEILAKIGQQVETRDQIREYFKPRLTDLLDLINCIIQEVEKILSTQDKQVLLIIDDLDKLMPDSALKLYYDHGGNLAYIKCNTIMTLPLSVFYSTKIGIIEGTVGNCYTLANIRLMDREGKRDKKSIEGYKLMEKVIASRADKDLLEEDATKKAIKYSGGVFRQLLELIRSAAMESASQKREQITTSDIIFAVGDKRNAMKRPLTSEYLDFLLEIQRNKMITIQDEAKRLELLHGLFALQYINGEEWCDVNPLLEDFLDEYQKIKLLNA